MLCRNFYFSIFCVYLDIKFNLKKSPNEDSNIFQGEKITRFTVVPVHIKVLTTTPFKESFAFNLRDLIVSC